MICNYIIDIYYLVDIYIYILCIHTYTAHIHCMDSKKSTSFCSGLFDERHLYVSGSTQMQGRWPGHFLERSYRVGDGAIVCS